VLEMHNQTIKDCFIAVMGNFHLIS